MRSVRAFGTVFGAFAAPFLRLPLPGPFKLIPLAFVAVGSGIGALGAAAATSSVEVIAERRRGLTFRWRVLPMKEKTLHIRPDEIDAFEISTHQTTHSGDDAFAGTTVTTYRVNVVTRSGKSFAIEELDLATLARQRLAALEAVCLAAPAAGPRAARSARRRRGG